MLFQVLAGSHNVRIDKYNEKSYGVGDVIETDEDLALRFGEEKFKRLYDEEAKRKFSEKKSSPKKNDESPKKTVKLKKKETADAVSD